MIGSNSYTACVFFVEKIKSLYLLKYTLKRLQLKANSNFFELWNSQSNLFFWLLSFTTCNSWSLGSFEHSVPCFPFCLCLLSAFGVLVFFYFFLRKRPDYSVWCRIFSFSRIFSGILYILSVKVLRPRKHFARSNGPQVLRETNGRPNLFFFYLLGFSTDLPNAAGHKDA